MTLPGPIDAARSAWRGGGQLDLLAPRLLDPHREVVVRVAPGATHHDQVGAAGRQRARPGHGVLAFSRPLFRVLPKSASPRGRAGDAAHL